MAQPITVTLPADVQQALEELSKKEGVSPDEVVGRAVKQHVFLRQFRSLRERLSAKAKNQGIATDKTSLIVSHETRPRYQRVDCRFDLAWLLRLSLAQKPRALVAPEPVAPPDRGVM